MADPTKPVPKPADDLDRLLARARKGDRTALPAVRELLRNPAAVAALGGELAELAERSFVQAMSPDDLAFREAVARKLQLLKAELLGADPSPVDRLLVERVAACWLQVQDADVRAAQATGQSPKWFELYQRRMELANRRFLAAVKTLAQVRKLALPVLQVNIAKKQVNVAAGAVPGSGQ